MSTKWQKMLYLICCLYYSQSVMFFLGVLRYTQYKLMCYFGQPLLTYPSDLPSRRHCRSSYLYTPEPVNVGAAPCTPHTAEPASNGSDQAPCQPTPPDQPPSPLFTPHRASDRVVLADSQGLLPMGLLDPWPVVHEVVQHNIQMMGLQQY
jgi:hypothetical protein